MNSLREYAEQVIAWAPPTVIGFFILALAVAIALALHNTVRRLLRRFLHARSPYIALVLSAAGDVTRFGLVILALFIALPLAPLSNEATLIVAKLLLLATIALVGWIALVAVDLAATLYLRRFRIDSEDNLLARKHVTQVRIIKGAVQTLVILCATGFALMTFEPVRQYGVSLFASAGVAGLIAGLAARPLFTNLIAGVQIAMTQPIRIDDAVLVEGEFGNVEEITSTYVVIKLWDWRRLIVPLSYFIEKPFQNWTHQGAAIIGSVMLYVDYAVPVERVRAKLNEIVKGSKLWDGHVVNLQVTDAKDHTIELRALVSARTSATAWDLRCEVREKLIAFLREEYPDALPRVRAAVEITPRSAEGGAAPIQFTAARDKIRAPSASEKNRSRG